MAQMGGQGLNWGICEGRLRYEVTDKGFYGKKGLGTDNPLRWAIIVIENNRYGLRKLYYANLSFWCLGRHAVYAVNHLKKGDRVSIVHHLTSFPGLKGNVSLVSAIRRLGAGQSIGGDNPEEIVDDEDVGHDDP